MPSRINLSTLTNKSTFADFFTLLQNPQTLDAATADEIKAGSLTIEIADGTPKSAAIALILEGLMDARVLFLKAGAPDQTDVISGLTRIGINTTDHSIHYSNAGGAFQAVAGSATGGLDRDGVLELFADWTQKDNKGLIPDAKIRHRYSIDLDSGEAFQWKTVALAADKNQFRLVIVSDGRTSKFYIQFSNLDSDNARIVNALRVGSRVGIFSGNNEVAFFDAIGIDATNGIEIVSAVPVADLTADSNYTVKIAPILSPPRALTATQIKNLVPEIEDSEEKIDVLDQLLKSYEDGNRTVINTIMQKLLDIAIEFKPTWETATDAQIGFFSGNDIEVGIRGVSTWAAAQNVPADTPGQDYIAFRLLRGANPHLYQLWIDSIKYAQKTPLDGNKVEITLGGVDYDVYPVDYAVAGYYATGSGLTLQKRVEKVHTNYAGDVSDAKFTAKNGEDNLPDTVDTIQKLVDWLNTVDLDEESREQIQELRNLTADLTRELVENWSTATNAAFTVLTGAVNQTTVDAATFSTTYTVPSNPANILEIIIRIPKGSNIGNYRIYNDGFTPILLSGLVPASNLSSTTYDYYLYGVRSNEEFAAGEVIVLEHHGKDIHTKFYGALVALRIIDALEGIGDGDKTRLKNILEITEPFLQGVEIEEWTRNATQGNVAITSGSYFADDDTLSINNTSSDNINNRASLLTIQVGHGIRISSTIFIVTGIDTSNTTHVVFTGYWEASKTDTTADSATVFIRHINHDLRLGRFARFIDILGEIAESQIPSTIARKGAVGEWQILPNYHVPTETANYTLHMHDIEPSLLPDVDNLDLIIRGIRLNASGWTPAAGARTLNFTINATDLRAIERAITTPGPDLKEIVYQIAFKDGSNDVHTTNLRRMPVVARAPGSAVSTGTGLSDGSVQVKHLAQDVRNLVDSKDSILAYFNGDADPLTEGWLSTVTNRFRDRVYPIIGAPSGPTARRNDRNNPLYRDNQFVQWQRAFAFHWKQRFTHVSTAGNENGSVQVFWGGNAFATAPAWLGASELTQGMGLWINRVRTDTGKIHADFDNWLYIAPYLIGTIGGSPARISNNWLSNASSHTTLYNDAVRPSSTPNRRIDTTGLFSSTTLGFFVPETNEDIDIEVVGVGETIYISVGNLVRAQIDLSEITGLNFGPRFGWLGDNDGTNGNQAWIQQVLIGTPDPIDALPRISEVTQAELDMRAPERNELLSWDETRAYADVTLPTNYLSWRKILIVLMDGDAETTITLPTAALNDARRDLTGASGSLGIDSHHRISFNRATRVLSRTSSGDVDRFAYMELF